jgi:hypothetical protein
MRSAVVRREDQGEDGGSLLQGSAVTNTWRGPGRSRAETRPPIAIATSSRDHETWHVFLSVSFNKLIDEGLTSAH